VRISFEDALHNLLVNAVELVKLAGPKYPSVLSICAILCEAAPINREQAQDPKWQEESPCWFFCKRRENNAGRTRS